MWSAFSDSAPVPARPSQHIRLQFPSRRMHFQNWRTATPMSSIQTNVSHKIPYSNIALLPLSNDADVPQIRSISCPVSSSTLRSRSTSLSYFQFSTSPWRFWPTLSSPLKIHRLPGKSQNDKVAGFFSLTLFYLSCLYVHMYWCAVLYYEDMHPVSTSSSHPKFAFYQWGMKAVGRMGPRMILLRGYLDLHFILLTRPILFSFLSQQVAIFAT